ncbi:MAG: flagellin [Gammaproteobacteria bacterium]|nr:flagellin [Gammaproteobacteria bacterium]
MAMVINTNVMSLNAQRNLTLSQRDQNQAMERLTTGKRINSAKDDAAGLSISSNMTSQIRGLNQAVRNANDGISMIQTAEGALEQSTNILQRMRELSVQSANGTQDDEDSRASLDAEFKQLTEELDRIAKTTTFNGQNLLNGDQKGLALQVGAEANQTISFSIQAMDAKTLGMGSVSVDMMGAEMTLAATVFAASLGSDIKEGDVLINGQSIGTFDTGASGDADSMNDLVSSINTNVSGVTAGLFTQLQASSLGDGVLDYTTAGEGIDITVADVNGGSQTYEVRKDTNSMEELASAIEDVTGGNISASINDDGQLALSNNSGSTITVAASGGTDLAVAMGMDTNVGDGLSQRGQLVLTSDHGDPITVERGDTGTLEDLANLGFRENSTQGEIKGAALSDSLADTSWGTGDVVVNGVAISAKDTDSLTGKIDNINAVTSETGVTANAYASVRIDMSQVDLSEVGNGTIGADLDINGVQIDFSTLDSTSTTVLEDMATVFNENTNLTGVSARVNGNNLILESDQGAINFGSAATADGQGSTIFQVVATSGAGAGAGLIGANFVTYMASGAAETNAIAAAETNFSTEAGIKLTSENGNPISVELGKNATAGEIGILDANSTAGGGFGTSISQTSIDTAANAQKAIDVIDKAIDTVNSERGSLGAVNNRLEYTIDNLESVSQNQSAARSRIMDADFALEAASLARSQILQQAGTAMLAQANSAPQQVLSLLQ